MTAARSIVSVEEFFYDDPNIPWKPLPEHDLKSPCYPIISIMNYHNFNNSFLAFIVIIIHVLKERVFLYYLLPF